MIYEFTGKVRNATGLFCNKNPALLKQYFPAFQGMDDMIAQTF